MYQEQNKLAQQTVQLGASGLIAILGLIGGSAAQISDRYTVLNPQNETITKPRLEPGDRLIDRTSGSGHWMAVSLVASVVAASYGAAIAFRASHTYKVYEQKKEIDLEVERLVTEVQGEARVAARKVLAENVEQEALLHELERRGIYLAPAGQPMQMQATIDPQMQQLPPAGQPMQQAPVQIQTVQSAPTGQATQAIVQPQPQAQSPRQPEPLPDGAKLVEMSTLNDINRYPVVMVVAGQGCGKTVTMATIFEALSGKKVIGTPKPLPNAVATIADLVFGKNPETGNWLHFGSMAGSDFSEYRDLTWHLNNQSSGGSMLEFLWAMRRESMNRQIGATPQSEPWRCFFDEASYTYNSGFNDPFSDGKAEKKAQTFVSGVNKDAFQNYRGQGLQEFFGSQVETVGSIGLANFSDAKDEAWHLFPGIAAIATAQRHGKENLARWLQTRVNSGYGIALLEKQGYFFEVLNLPTLEYMKKFDPSAQG